ncbi:methyltransferase, partial [Nocardiopsis alba]
MTPLLIDQLPPPLPAERIIELNRPKTDLHTLRHYSWNGWDFEVPPGVFVPGETSRMIHRRLLDDEIDVRGRSYAAMGVGLGVEVEAREQCEHEGLDQHDQDLEEEEEDVT